MLTKAVVLCAGEGSRLRPLTFSRPKHLLPVAGMPILGWALNSLRDVGIRDVCLVVGYQAEAIRQYVGAGDEWGMDVTYVEQVSPLGIGHAVNLAREYVAGEPFLVYLGDNLFEEGIGSFVEPLRDAEWGAGLLLKRVEDPRRFGVAEVCDGHVMRVVEKPEEPPSDLAIVGVYAFKQTIFEAIDSLEPSGRGELEITDAIQKLLSGGAEIVSREVSGLWEDAGEPQALLRTNREWLERKLEYCIEGSAEDCEIEGVVAIEKGTRASGSQFIGPCRVGRNCTVENATIGPNVSIADGCEVVNARLENCIVQRNSQIRHLSSGLVDSVLGEYVEIQGRNGDMNGSPLSLLMGDMGHAKAM